MNQRRVVTELDKYSLVKQDTFVFSAMFGQSQKLANISLLHCWYVRQLVRTAAGTYGSWYVRQLVRTAVGTYGSWYVRQLVRTAASTYGSWYVQQLVRTAVARNAKYIFTIFLPTENFQLTNKSYFKGHGGVKH